MHIKEEQVVMISKPASKARLWSELKPSENSNIDAPSVRQIWTTLQLCPIPWTPWHTIKKKPVSRSDGFSVCTNPEDTILEWMNSHWSWRTQERMKVKQIAPRSCSFQADCRSPFDFRKNNKNNNRFSLGPVPSRALGTSRNNKIFPKVSFFVSSFNPRRTGIWG